MIRKFDPDTNPYADDLLRLSLVPPGRYTDVERHTLARIIASKLYKVSLVEPYYTDWGFSTWVSEIHDRNFVEIDVLFDFDVMAFGTSFSSERYNGIKSALIVLSAGTHGVVELFNGVPDHSTIEHVWHAIEQMHAGEHGGTSNEFGAISHRSDDEVAGDYVGDTGAGRPGNGAGGGDGGQGGGDVPNGIPGSGGVGELINHPVLFTIERRIFDAILEQV